MQTFITTRKILPASPNNFCLQIWIFRIIFLLFPFQAAVPRSFSLQMLSPSGSALPPGGTITQEMRITSTAKVNCFEYSDKSYHILTMILFRPPSGCACGYRTSATATPCWSRPSFPGSPRTPRHRSNETRTGTWWILRLSFSRVPPYDRNKKKRRHYPFSVVWVVYFCLVLFLHESVERGIYF